MSECGQAYPECIAPRDINNSVKAVEHRPQRKDASHNKTVFGFHPFNQYWKWCAQGFVQESGPSLSNMDTGRRERDTN